MNRGELHPFELIGWEGLWGCVFHLVMLPIFYQIPCTQQICSNGRVEDVVLAFKELSNSSTLVSLSIGIIICISLFNGLGVMITKYASAAQRTIVDQSRVIFVWLFFMMTGIETFKYLQLIGFIVLVFGTLIYNDLILNTQLRKLH